jgi:hypothetical protein
MHIKITIFILLLIFGWNAGAWAQDRKFEIISFDNYSVMKKFS